MLYPHMMQVAATTWRIPMATFDNRRIGRIMPMATPKQILGLRIRCHLWRKRVEK